ncbi:MAG: hypothetical protein HQL93_02190 [Magnetococcales bacterium]|nr:hypothetical protein [Magnetococcales bacterium]
MVYIESLRKASEVKGELKALQVAPCPNSITNSSKKLLPKSKLSTTNKPANPRIDSANRARQEKAATRKVAVTDTVNWILKIFPEWKEIGIPYSKADVVAAIRRIYASVGLPDEKAVILREATDAQIEVNLSAAATFQTGNRPKLENLAGLILKKIRNPSKSSK